MKSRSCHARDRELELVKIGGGSFLMGSSPDEVDRCVEDWGDRLVERSYTKPMFRTWISKECPQHEVVLDAFALGKYPVTNGLFGEFVDATGHPPPESLRGESRADHPVWGVSFDDVQAFLAWLRDGTGRAYRLPSEAEWEYAARGPTRQQYPFGEVFDPRLCNTYEAGIGMTTPVSRYADCPSPFGVCDLAGNVEEWTSSHYAPYPGGAFVQDHLTENLGMSYRVLRGGSFMGGGDLARGARRHGPIPNPRFKYVGFRIAELQST
jgi:formylglycine-generating enzyme required for sulfatase activity